MSKTEAQTRKELIDRKLREAGWNILDRTQVVKEFDIKVGLPEGVCEGHQFSVMISL